MLNTLAEPFTTRVHPILQLRGIFVVMPQAKRDTDSSTGCPKPPDRGCRDAQHKSHPNRPPHKACAELSGVLCSAMSSPGLNRAFSPALPGDEPWKPLTRLRAHVKSCPPSRGCRAPSCKSERSAQWGEATHKFKGLEKAHGMHYSYIWPNNSPGIIMHLAKEHAR